MTQPGMVALLTRSPSITREEFNSHWLNRHAAIVIPWALANGCVSYVQIHNPRLSAFAQIPGNKPEDLDISSYDGAAELVLEPPTGFEASEKSKDFFPKVVVPDEKRFLAGPSHEIVRFVEGRLIDGDRIVLVEDGKIKVREDGTPAVDQEGVFKTWEQWAVEK